MSPESKPALRALRRPSASPDDASGIRFFDTNVWWGPWPFAPLPGRGAAALRRHLAAHHIEGALVSAFEALWQDDPMPANRALRAALAREPALRPLPLINPAVAPWREHLAECLGWAGALRAVRVAPAYHGYALGEPGLKMLAGLAADEGIRIVMTARLVDERHEHHAVRLRPGPLDALTRWLRRNPRLHPLVQGLTRAELEKLAPEVTNFTADLGYAEWHDTLRVLRAVLPVRRLVLGSLTPLHVTRAQVDKIAESSLPRASRAAVARINALKFFDLPR